MRNNKTRLTLFCSDRVVDRQVRLQTDIRDPSGEGSCVRVANHLHPRGTARSSGRRYGDHPVQLSRRLSKRLASLRPRPCKCWHQRRGWGRLPHVLCHFLGAGLVLRSVRLKWSGDIITHYYALLHIYLWHSLNRKHCRFPLCKWDYIHSTFYSNWAMEQIHRGNILVKRTGRCSCSGCTSQKMF